MFQQNAVRRPTRPANPPSLVALLAVMLLLSQGCVTNGYRAAKKDPAGPVPLHVAFEPGPLEAELVTVITYNGPGSWKRDSFWDEYVLALRNPGAELLTVSAAALTGPGEAVHEAGTRPWALEKESRSLEQKYRAAGIAFVRYTTPGLAILGAGTMTIVGTGVFSSAAATAATATIVALPLYYVGVVAINHSNKRAMEREFARRRLVLPLTLAPGESRTGSLFFPMVPSPRSLSLSCSTATTPEGRALLPLDFLRDLHVGETADPAGARAASPR